MLLNPFLKTDLIFQRYKTYEYNLYYILKFSFSSTQLKPMAFSLVINSLILDENDEKRASNSVAIIDLDNAASESIDILNTDIENIRNDSVDEMAKLYSEIE